MTLDELNFKANSILDFAKSENGRKLTEQEELEYKELKKAILNLSDETTSEEVKNVVVAQKELLNKKVNNTMDKIDFVSAMKEFARSGKREFHNAEGKLEFALTSAGNSGILMPKSIPSWSPLKGYANGFRQGFAALGVNPFTTSVADNLTIPAPDDTANLANSDQEGATSGVNLDPTYTASINLDLLEYHSKAVWVSNKVIGAQDFDITQFVLPQLLNRIERHEQVNWTAAVIAAGAGNVGKTTASATAVTLPELIDWDESQGAVTGEPSFYLVSPALRAAIRKLADTTNRTFFSIEGGLTTLFGKPLFVNASLGALTTGQTTGMLVSGHGGAVIRDNTNSSLVVYENIPQYPGQKGYEVISYSAFGFTSQGVKTLKML